jgi:eukaryotic-like serine/threonine-protein kinase
MASLLDRLQRTLGDSYRIERELGGGGMSKVFLAEEVALHRRVVIKVLSTEVAAEISGERFRREIQLAARLQHPHIVPVLQSGETDGVPFYTMPFVEGESLRARLDQRGAMPFADALPILRDVLRALEYAHGAGVVHRDIKPDNVLLAGNSASVADFGIAKAITAARAEGAAGATLTSVGMSVGTPAYIAPEQAAGDADVDHRADLYSFGCMAFELIAGEPPFNESSPQKMLAAHLSKPPRELATLRSDVPRALADLVKRTLAKDPADRPQSAAEILKEMEAAVSGGGHESATVSASASGRALVRGLLLWATCFVAVAVALRILTITVGLPSWAFPLGVGLALLGLPAVLGTWFVHHRTSIARSTATSTPGGTQPQHSTLTRLAVKASPFVSWRRTARGGVWVAGAFGVVVGAWMLMWAFGIGSVGNLMAQGKIATNDPLLVADFASPPSDSTLGTVVTEALRTDIAQSKVMVPVSATALRDILRRMERAPNTRIDVTLAREIASREGIGALLVGDVLKAGAGYVLNARLVEAATGNELAAFRKTAAGPTGVIDAIDALSKEIREKLGESLKAVRAAPPLSRVTTSSLEALRKYTQGSQLINRDNDAIRGLSLIEEAIALDSGFATAYRGAYIALNNGGIQRSKQRAYLERAYQLKSRMTELERLMTETAYYNSRWHWDADKALTALQGAMDAGNTAGGYNGLGNHYRNTRQWTKSVDAYNHAITIDSTFNFPYGNRYAALIALGRWAALDSAVLEAERRLSPLAARSARIRAFAASERGRFADARTILDSALTAGVPFAERVILLTSSAAVHQLRGELRSAAQDNRNLDSLSARAIGATGRLERVSNDAWLQSWLLGNPKRAIQLLDSALKGGALDSLEVDDRPYLELARAYALAGSVSRARELVKAFDAALPDARLPVDVQNRQLALGEIAIAERRYDAAIEALRLGDVGTCMRCVLPSLARAFDLTNRPDSTIATLERYLGITQERRSPIDAMSVAPAHKRLAELYDAKGDAAKAITHYRAYIEMWKGADPELQPWVMRARQRLAVLERARG